MKSKLRKEKFKSSLGAYNHRKYTGELHGQQLVSWTKSYKRILNFKNDRSNGIEIWIENF